MRCTGPVGMRALVGKCFSTLSKDGHYEYLNHNSLYITTPFQNGAKSLDLRCVFHLAPLGAGGPNQDTPRIQY